MLSDRIWCHENCVSHIYATLTILYHVNLYNVFSLFFVSMFFGVNLYAEYSQVETDE